MKKSRGSGDRPLFISQIKSCNTLAKKLIDQTDWRNITEHFINKIDERKLGKVKDEEENYLVEEMN